MLFVTNDSLNSPFSEGQAPAIRSCSAHFRENTELSQKVTSIRSNNFTHDFFSICTVLMPQYSICLIIPSLATPSKLSKVTLD